MFNWVKKCIPKKNNIMDVQEIIMIAAIQNDRAIGYKCDLIHSIKNDMKHFVAQTIGNTVIMGRKNWESIPERFRPFKNRENIIVTRDKNYVAKGVIVVHSLEEAIKRARNKKIYIIGGGEIYTLGMQYATMLDLTLIDSNKPGDVYFPKFEHMFKLSETSERIFDEKTTLNYQFQKWIRI